MKLKTILLALFSSFCGFAAHGRDGPETRSEAPCGGSLTEPQGEFFSPDYPHMYPSNTHCTWHLMSFDWQTISLTFTFVDLESCCDFVSVYDGATDQAPLLGNVTGNQGNSFNSSSRYMTVTFSSDYSWTQQGFHAEWTFLGGAPCGGILAQSHGEFFSPNYPYNYPENAVCKWRLQSSSGQVVSLSFKFVALETGWDLIHVYDGLSDQDPLLGIVTGNQRNSFNSSSRYMTVVFSSDSGWSEQGFGAEWSFLDSDTRGKEAVETSPDGTACGGHLTQSQGNFFSPNYPHNYPNNSECTWTILSPEGQVILLTFTTVRLEDTWDFIHVYDGPNKMSPHKGFVTGSQRASFSSSGRYMTVVFASDYGTSDKGFQAEWIFIDSKPTTKEEVETTPDTELMKPPQTTTDPEPTKPPQTLGYVDCLSGQMNVVISKSYIESLGYRWNELYLGDHKCKASTDDDDYITFNFPLHSCSTWRKIHNGYIVYTNIIKATRSSEHAISTHFLPEVSCMIGHQAIVQTFYEAKEIRNTTISGTGQFNFTIALYRSSSFSHPITDFPYQVEFGQELYIQVQLNPADPSLHLFIDSCVASPNSDFTSLTYDLIRNRCPSDTVHIYTNGENYYARFRYHAVMFLPTHKHVFLKCDVSICTDNDNSLRCRQGCRPHRKRSLSSIHHTEILTLGPAMH